MNNFQPINNGESLQSARNKINNIGQNALGPEHNIDENSHGSIVVKTVAQNLNDAQKSRARANIGAPSMSDIVSGAVRYDAQQALTEAQKMQARKNIGAISSGEVTGGAVRYDVVQNLTPAQQAQARTNTGAASITALNNKLDLATFDINMPEEKQIVGFNNLGLQYYKPQLSDTDLDNLPTDGFWWGETYTQKVDYQLDRMCFFIQTPKVVNGNLFTYQTKFNGASILRRSKVGNGEWSEWSDIGTDNLYFDNGLSKDENGEVGIVGGDTMFKIGEFKHYAAESIIYPTTTNNVQFGFMHRDNPYTSNASDMGLLFYYNREDASLRYHYQLFINANGVYMRSCSDPLNASVPRQTWYGIEWEELGGNVGPATTEKYGTVILGYGEGDYRDAGRVATMDEDGKIPNKNLRDAYSNPTEGGIVKVTLNGGTSDANKVPLIGSNGTLSFMVLPDADKQMKGAVTLASNTGNSTDNGKVPVLGADGKLNVNTLPAGLSPAPVNGRLYVGKDGTWVQDSNFVNAYNNTDGYLVNTDIIAGESDVLGVTFQIIGNQYSASTGFSGIPYFCVIQAYWHGINNTFYDPACIALGNAANFNNITVFRRLVDGSYRICIRFESKQYNNFSVAAYANNDVSGRNRVTNISSSAVPSDAVNTKNVSVRVGYNDTNANLSTVDWNANHLITEGWVRFGGEINLRPPETGGWGSGMYFRKKSDNSNLAAIGAVFYDEAFSKFYIGWGANPLDPATGLALGDSVFTYKGQNIWHAGNLGDATTTKAGLVVLAGNTGNSTDNGKVPVLGANGKLDAKVIPSGSTTRFTYTVYSNDTGSEVRAMLRIIEAKDAIFAATIEVLGYGTRIYDKAGTTMYQSLNLKKTVEIYSSCYENGDESFLSSAYKINGQYVGNLTYDGNDILIDVGNLLTYTENDINRYTSVTRNIINETN